MAGLNKAQLIGRLGKDPEVRNFDGGGVNCTFSVATSETWKDKQTGEKKERTEWHNIVIWGKLAEIAGKYLHKGDQVYISGPIRTRVWEKDNVKRYITEIFADEMLMLTTKKDGGAPAASNVGRGASAESSGGGGSDDLPF